jgi:hypothetical protein
MLYLSSVQVMCLRKKMVLGLILLLCGLPVTLWMAGFRTKVSSSIAAVAEADEQQMETGDWKVSGFFTTGERLIFDIKDGKNWVMEATDPDPSSPTKFDSLQIGMSIIDPKGGKTNFTITFLTVNSPTAVMPSLSFFGGNLTSNDGGLTMEPENIWVANNRSVYYRQIGGIVNYDGTYTAVVDEGSAPSTPPMYLKLEEQAVSTKSPYLSIVPIGVAIMVSGIALLVWSWRRPKYRTKQKGHSSR